MSQEAEHFPWVLWRVPLLLAVLTLFGLIDALLIDGPLARVFAWLALSIPLGVAVWCILKAKR
jgi:hypothetical protein